MNVPLPMIKPKTMFVDWRLSTADYEKLKVGFSARSMDDRWDIMFRNGTLHLYRSWTGYELYCLSPTYNQTVGNYTVSSFMVEQSPNRYTETDEQKLQHTLQELLRIFLDVTV